MDTSNNRLKFCLTATHNSTGYYKKLICGTNNEPLYKLLVGKIRMCAIIHQENTVSRKCN